MHRRTWWIVPVVALAGLGAGCGDDDEGASDDDAPTTEAEGSNDTGGGSEECPELFDGTIERDDDPSNEAQIAATATGDDIVDGVAEDLFGEGYTVHLATFDLDEEAGMLTQVPAPAGEVKVTMQFPTDPANDSMRAITVDSGGGPSAAGTVEPGSETVRIIEEGDGSVCFEIQMENEYQSIDGIVHVAVLD